MKNTQQTDDPKAFPVTSARITGTLLQQLNWMDFPAGDCWFTLEGSVSVCSLLFTALHIQPSDSSPLQTELAQKSLPICSPKKSKSSPNLESA
jgi:hypothetical protein